VLVACWSVKGGVGTTTVAAALALRLAAEAAGGVVLADLAGDAPAVLGLPEPSSPGLAGWLAAGAQVPADALARIEIEVAPGLGLLPRGPGHLYPARAGVLATLFDRGPRTVVADCGRADGAAVVAVIGLARQSLLVTRPCYMALRRAMAAPVQPTGIVLVDEPGRALSGDDLHGALNVPVVATVPLDPKVARQVDAGLLRGRLPRSLDPLRKAA
jgi:MinD-like ATPase involved in chromosome partitioning or flagellar assembly